MKEEIQQLKEIKEYLLGFASRPEAMEKVEERLMTDEEYHNEMTAAEEELIQNYVDDELSVTEKAAFERHFLLSNERRERVEFARAFRKYIDEQEMPPAVKAPARKRFSFAEWFAVSPVIRVPMAFAATLLIVLSSFFGWNAYLAYSQKQQSLALLNKAYKNGRPLESRITELDYADFDKLRGNDQDRIDRLALERANQIIKERADENPNVTNLLLLGRLYLAQKDFEQASKQLERAKTLDPNNAEIFNDLGVAAFEQGLLLEKTDSDARMKFFRQANEHFYNALKIDKSLRESLFNKARCLERLSLFNEAKEAWQEYLKYDSTSGWAAEAKSNLEALENHNSQDMTSEDREGFFLSAFRNGDADEAFKLASQNRELITKQFLPQKLAMSLIKASGEKKTETLQALTYLGELEKARNNDNYASDLADLYRNLPNDKIEILKKAQSAVEEGYELCQKDNFSQARLKFIEARELFLQGGNEIEAKAVCDYFIAYCLYFSDRRQEGYEAFTQVDAFYTEKHYEWFSLMNQDWLIGGRHLLQYSTSSETIQKCEAGLKKAENMRDVYMTQKFLTSLLSHIVFDGQNEKIFAYIGRIIEYAGMPNGSLRQKARGFDWVFRKLAFHPKLMGLSLMILGEGILIGEASKDQDPLFVLYREKNAGMVYTQIGDLPAAEKWLTAAKESVSQIEEKTKQNQELSDIFYRLGNLESMRANFARSIQYYDSALDIQRSLNTQSLLYQIKKSRLVAYRVLGDDDRIESDLPETIQLVEKYRKELTGEQERNIFFDNQQEVYDIAVEHKVRRNQYQEAYNYAEASSSRSLLNSLQRNSDAPVDQYNGEVVSPDYSQPLRINEIQEQMPPGVQILQYFVLDKKLLIWLISRDTFLPLESEISSSDLKAKVSKYAELIKAKDREQQDQAKTKSAELYDLLIKPAAPYLDKNKDICLIRNKSLFDLPFSSLQSPESRSFIEDFNLFLSSSASVFIMSTREASKRNSSGYERILSVGNPAFDKKKLPDLADVSESTDEARVIAGYYQDPKILLDKTATRSAFLNAIKDHEVINFAGHYLINLASPSLSQLVMAKVSDNDSDNFLTNADLMKEKLPLTKLVVLSACQTGIEGDFKGEGSVGLTRTFLALGVPLVVASAWPVDSKATSILIKKFHYYRKQENLSTVRALRKAQLDMIHSAGGKFSDPYYWAAFAAFGGYAEF